MRGEKGRGQRTDVHDLATHQRVAFKQGLLYGFHKSGMASTAFTNLRSKTSIGSGQRTEMFVFGHDLDHRIGAGNVGFRVSVEKQKSGKGPRVSPMWLQYNSTFAWSIPWGQPSEGKTLSMVVTVCTIAM